MPTLDFCVVGCVAVTRSGGRTGKGAGFADLEQGLFRELGLVSSATPIATTVHSSQVVANSEVVMESHNSALHYIATELELIATRTEHPQPERRGLGQGPPGPVRRHPVFERAARGRSSAGGGDDVTAVERLSGVVLLPTDGSPAGLPVDVLISDGRIAAIEQAGAKSARRLLAMPALVNAHDHARPLSPTSFGAAGKPLETWLLRLAAMPAMNPYLGALAAFGRAARGGAGSVMAHYTRFHGPMPPVEEAKAMARAAADVGVRVTLAVFMRDRNPLVYGDEEKVLAQIPGEARATVEAQFLGPTLSTQEQVARVEATAEATESATFSVQFGPTVRNGAQTRCLPQSRTRHAGPGGACTCICWKPAISALSPTAPIRMALCSGSRRLAFCRRA